MAHQRILPKSSKGGNIFPDIDYRTCKAVRAGNLVFVEGQTGLTMDNMSFVGEGDPAAQADNAMKNVKMILEAAGARMEDICKITTYVTDISYRDLVYPVLAKHMPDVHPCSTGVVVKALGKTYADFEIDVFAVIPEDRA
ncbi:MAG: RidA family protein [Chloroflexota bacterium]|nr:RidA family protein [Chloroflexota bacterium]MDE2951110.1 RidA family protein [Chloroflexota bacterium]